MQTAGDPGTARMRLTERETCASEVVFAYMHNVFRLEWYHKGAVILLTQRV